MFDQFHPCALWSSFWVVLLSSDIQRVSGQCLWMKSHEVAEPIEASSLYSCAPQFNVGDFLRSVYA